MAHSSDLPTDGRSRRRPRRRPSGLAGLPLVLASALFTSVPPAAAAGRDAFDAQTRADIQTVITSQLQAFEKGDARAAEEFASPGIRERFPEPSQFLDMVKSQYGALIHPRSTQFAEATDSPHGPLQKVVVVAADGTVWSAIYSFEKVEGRWRITGCGLEKDESQRAI